MRATAAHLWRSINPNHGATLLCLSPQLLCPATMRDRQKDHLADRTEVQQASHGILSPLSTRLAYCPCLAHQRDASSLSVLRGARPVTRTRPREYFRSHACREDQLVLSNPGSRTEAVQNGNKLHGRPPAAALKRYERSRPTIPNARARRQTRQGGIGGSLTMCIAPSARQHTDAGAERSPDL